MTTDSAALGPENSCNRYPGAQAGTPRAALAHQHAAASARLRTSTVTGLSRLAIFAVLMAAGAFVLDGAVDRGLKRITTSKYGTMNRAMAGDVNAGVVVNGSSRALVHYDPRPIETAMGLSVYNLGLNGVLVDVQRAVLEAYLKQNTGTKLVIQNLDAFSLKKTQPGEIYDPPLYVPYLDQPQLYLGLLSIDPAVWKWRHIPLYGYTVEDLRFTWARGLLAYAGVQPPEDYVQGFNPRHLEWTGDFEAFRESTRNGVTYPIEPDGVAALERIIEASKQAGAEVLLVYSPEYFEAQGLVRNRAEIFDAFATIARRHRVQLWDYSDSELGHRKSLFYNSQHLNAEGAAQFSEQLASRLEAARLVR